MNQLHVDAEWYITSRKRYESNIGEVSGWCI